MDLQLFQVGTNNYMHHQLYRHKIFASTRIKLDNTNTLDLHREEYSIIKIKTSSTEIYKSFHANNPCT